MVLVTTIYTFTSILVQIFITVFCQGATLRPFWRNQVLLSLFVSTCINTQAARFLLKLETYGWHKVVNMIGSSTSSYTANIYNQSAICNCNNLLHLELNCGKKAAKNVNKLRGEYNMANGRVNYSQYICSVFLENHFKLNSSIIAFLMWFFMHVLKKHTFFLF